MDERDLESGKRQEKRRKNELILKCLIALLLLVLVILVILWIRGAVIPWVSRLAGQLGAGQELQQELPVFGS